RHPAGSGSKPIAAGHAPARNRSSARRAVAVPRPTVLADDGLGRTVTAELHFDDRFGLLVDAEWTAREQRRLTQRLRNARLRYPASLEDVDFTPPRGVSRDVVLSFGTGAWIRDHHNVLITGPTGIGKSWLACAFAESACRHGFTATYVRAPRLLHEL